MVRDYLQFLRHEWKHLHVQESTLLENPTKLNLDEIVTSPYFDGLADTFDENNFKETLNENEAQALIWDHMINNKNIVHLIVVQQPEQVLKDLEITGRREEERIYGTILYACKTDLFDHTTEENTFKLTKTSAISKNDMQVESPVYVTEPEQ